MAQTIAGFEYKAGMLVRDHATGFLWRVPEDFGYQASYYQTVQADDAATGAFCCPCWAAASRLRPRGSKATSGMCRFTTRSRTSASRVILWVRLASPSPLKLDSGPTLSLVGG